MSRTTRMLWSLLFMALGACGAKTSEETGVTGSDAFPGAEDEEPADDVAAPESEPSADNDEDQEQLPPEPQSGRLRDSTGLEFTWQCDEQQECSLTTQAENSCGTHSFAGPSAGGLAPNVPLICDACTQVHMPHFWVLDMEAGDHCRPLSCESDTDCAWGFDSNKCVNNICHAAEANAEDYTPHEVWVLCVAAAARGEYAELKSLRQTLLETCPDTFQCHADCGWDVGCSLQCAPAEGARCPLPESCR